MARIKCKNCGKAYRYETEGCCPECGAYNRPPRREQVNADGTIYHMNDHDYLEIRHAQADTHSGKVCFEEKECHEEKVCYEEKTHSKKAPAFVAPMLNQTKQQSGNKKGKKSGLTIVVIIAALIGVVTNILENHQQPDYPEPGYDEPCVAQYTVQDDEATVYLENAAEVYSGTLCYYNQENEYLEIGPDTADFYGEQCVMTFYVGDDYQYAESVDVSYGDDNWISLWIGD